MSNVVRVEYPDLSTELAPNEVTLTGDSVKSCCSSRPKKALSKLKRETLV